MTRGNLMGLTGPSSLLLPDCLAYWSSSSSSFSAASFSATSFFRKGTSLAFKDSL
jgi:hypothetical protein